MSITYLEPFKKKKLSTLPKSINLNETKFHEARLFRLLCGTADIEYNYFGKKKVIKQRIQLFDAKGTVNNKLSKKIFNTYLKPSTLSINDLDNYFKYTKNVNYSLINDLLYEYSYYFIYTNKGNHTSAFIHAYRILEYISYSFPLAHASMSTKYHDTYKSLQSYFTKDGGELTFLKKFVANLFDGEPILSSTADINILTPDNDSKKSIYNNYKKLLNNFDSSCDDSTHCIHIKYPEFIDIIKHVRNRYFHFAVGGQQNIRTSEILYPDLFFKQINSHAINWISIIYFEVLKYMIERWK